MIAFLRRRALLPWWMYPAGALALTWPLAASFTTHLPLGELADATVPWLNLWTLEWNADRLAHGLSGYWDAPIFFPARHALAMSEPMGLLGVVFAPLRAAFGAVAGYNLTLLIVLVTNAFAARRLLLTLRVPDLVADCTGAMALGLPFVMKELGVLQLTAIAPLLWALTELCSLFRGPERAAIFRLTLAVIATLWSCVYYALFLAVVLLLALPFFVRRSLFDVRFRLQLLASASLLLLCASPLLYVQHDAVGRAKRSADDLYHGSASAAAYLRAPAKSLIAHAVPALRGSGGRALFPGFLLCSLAIFGVVARLRSRDDDRRFVIYCAVAFAFSLLLSFGTRWHLGAWQPYASIMQAYVPGYAQLRSPYRFAVFTHLFLVVFAGVGLCHMAQLAPQRPWLLPLLAAAVLLEVLPLGVTLRRFPSEALHEPFVAWLAAHPGGAVTLVPPALGGKVRDYEPTTLAMLQSLVHHHPLTDGYSGFFPPAADRVAALAKRFPSPGSIRALQRAGTRYVVVDNAWLEQHSPERIRPEWWNSAERVFSSPDTNIYAIGLR